MRPPDRAVEERCADRGKVGQGANHSRVFLETASAHAEPLRGVVAEPAEAERSPDPAPHELAGDARPNHPVLHFERGRCAGLAVGAFGFGASRRDLLRFLLPLLASLRLPVLLRLPRALRGRPQRGLPTASLGRGSQAGERKARGPLEEVRAGGGTIGEHGAKIGRKQSGAQVENASFCRCFSSFWRSARWPVPRATPGRRARAAALPVRRRRRRAGFVVGAERRTRRCVPRN